MPTIKTKFTLKSEDLEQVKKAISNCGTSSEDVINDYLHKEVGTQLAESITNFMPRSNRNKVHAKDSKWWDQVNYNLAVGIENKTSGKNSFYYLYYPATGTGTSAKNGPNDFMEQGMNREYNNIVNQMINRLIQNIDKELK